MDAPPLPDGRLALTLIERLKLHGIIFYVRLSGAYRNMIYRIKIFFGRQLIFWLRALILLRDPNFYFSTFDSDEDDSSNWWKK